MFKKLILFSINRPKTIMGIIAALTLIALIQFPRVTVDTDPENMLSDKEFVRVFHHDVKREFGLYDFIVLGIVNESHPDGVFNVETLNTMYAITEKIKPIEGVIAREIISPSTKDNIRQGGLGTVIFEWLMPEPITNESQARLIQEEALDNPLFKGTMISEDGKALALYIPIKQKDMSYRIAQAIQSIIHDLKGDEQYYITGLPVAEDTFGVEMFKQMALSAPLAMLIIFVLLWIFFKNIKLIVSPMILAMVTVIITMGALIGFGFPVHIMSSMIPIFLMPIAVLDSVHILSEFFDTYRSIGSKRETISTVLHDLFTPMLYTSITSAVGFFSLSFSPIPPVQVFGVFVALGITVAWLLTLTFIPAYISLMNEKSFADFGSPIAHHAGTQGVIDRALSYIGRTAVHRYKTIFALCIVFTIIAGIGISRITVNDNPVKWFSKNHRIRVADRILNKHFGGTYTAYLVFEAVQNNEEIFKEPSMLLYVDKLQTYLDAQGGVGKSTALTDVVKKVYYELLGGDPSYYTIPQTKRAVAQTLISYENSHKPDDLWHFTNPSYSKLNIWLQLKSGDNRDMEQVLNQVNRFIDRNPPPYAVSHHWAGLTYINVVWQNKMVVGMLKNFFGCFIIVFFIMTFLFRSPLRGLVSLIPLSITIVFIYGLLGILGKDYDMPVAVLSALTLGLSIDFAIHFIQRARVIFASYPSWERTALLMFQEPARAITRNALVIAIGFLPLLAAPLIPYKTVGFFMFAIMLVSGIGTLFILPALLTAFPGLLAQETENKMVCHCGYCVIIATAVSVGIAFVLSGYTTLGWEPTVLISIVIVGILAGICSKLSKITYCIPKHKEENHD
ncbi:MAG: MMPL family transporter [Elusimicrobia bacterium]|nr:MMPL family transporter [Elusimicrobiota bacterium]MBD3412307.1 MMPL family transporter [Elusimicrobiota bacterium]